MNELYDRLHTQLSEATKTYGSLAHSKFPDSDTAKATLHLAEEAVELIGVNLGMSSHTVAQEAAAVYLILSHYCHMANIDLGKAVLDEWRRISLLPVVFDPASGYSRVVKPKPE